MIAPGSGGVGTGASSEVMEVPICETVLEKLDLFVDFQRRIVPNPTHPDQPVTKIK